MYLRVTGLDTSTTEGELMDVFSKIGKVESVNVIRDIETGQSKRLAIVHMPVESQGQEAISKLNGSMLGDRRLTVFRLHQVLPGEMEFREWLNDHAQIALQKIGIRTGQAVLDYGCGAGIFSIAAAGMTGPTGRVFALDTRGRALERLKEIASQKALKNIETKLLNRSDTSIGLANESVDAILLYDVLQEIDDKPALLKELHRILRKDGFLSIFPMHMGTEKCLEIVNNLGIFRFRDSYCPPGLKSSSEIINLNKRATPGT